MYYNEKKQLNDRMLSMLIKANRERISSSLKKGSDSYSIAISLFPRPEDMHENAISHLQGEIEFIQYTGKSSFDSDFLPKLSGYKDFSSYMLDCWNVLAKTKSYSAAKGLGDIRDHNLIYLMGRYCELPSVIVAIANSNWRYSTDPTELNKLTLPDAGYRKSLLAELEGAESYRELIKLTHSVILTEKEVTEHIERLTRFDLSSPHTVIFEAWLHDDQGEKVRKLQDYSYPLSAVSVLKLSESNPNHQAMQAVHAMNMQLICKVSDELNQKAEAEAAAKHQETVSQQAEIHAQRVKEVTARVNEGTATAEELSEYLAW